MTGLSIGAAITPSFWLLPPYGVAVVVVVSFLEQDLLRSVASGHLSNTTAAVLQVPLLWLLVSTFHAAWERLHLERKSCDHGCVGGAFRQRHRSQEGFLRQISSSDFHTPPSG